MTARRRRRQGRPCFVVSDDLALADVADLLRVLEFIRHPPRAGAPSLARATGARARWQQGGHRCRCSGAGGPAIRTPWRSSAGRRLCLTVRLALAGLGAPGASFRIQVGWATQPRHDRSLAVDTPFLSVARRVPWPPPCSRAGMSALLAVVALSDLFAVHAGVRLYTLIDEDGGLAFAPRQEVDDADALYRTAGKIQGATFLACAIGFIVWFFWMRRCAEGTWAGSVPQRPRLGGRMLVRPGGESLDALSGRNRHVGQRAAAGRW